MAEINSLPPGWDCKYDPRTARYYFINHYTKVTTWDDPRLKYRQIHGTPTHVPSIPVEHIPLQDLSNISRMSPAQATRAVARNAVSNGAHHPLLQQAVSRMQETNLTQVPTDTEQSVGKISTMFPTVSETHIRLLMKKYYNREAVVISALQVEKYPITTPGPYTTPPPSRNFTTGASVPLYMTPPPGVRHMTSRTGSPIGRQGSAVGSPLFGEQRSSPKPHSSPKMKLRYMKSIFPQVEETVLLEVLGNNENNVQKASEALKEMGFEKKEMKLAKTKSSKAEQAKLAEQAAAKAALPPKIYTAEEKANIKSSLQEKYKDIPERVIMMALESVDYNNSRACQILDIMMQEESTSKSSSDSTPKKDEKEPMQENSSPNTNSYRSSYLIKSSGPNSTLVKGSDNGMLLEDYVSWDGPDPTLRDGSKQCLAMGPNRSLLMQRPFQACGPSADNRKGPALGLAKGSIYSQLKTVVMGESRGK